MDFLGNLMTFFVTRWLPLYGQKLRLNHAAWKAVETAKPGFLFSNL
jgi:hypothetical protein